MADEPKPEQSTSISPAPTDVAGKPTDNAQAAKSQKILPEPLADGTVPTVLNPGETHRTVAKGKVSLTAIYRKADVMTTLLTFAGAIVAGAIILGGYSYITRDQAKPSPSPKVTALNKSDLDKLTAFFGGNSAGSSAEILTISSSSLFKNRVAVGSDMKITGGLSVDGTTALGDLTVDKTSTLGVVNTRGQLTVNGPLTVQSPALFNGGGSFKGNISATGNGSFGGSISAGSMSVQDISVNGSLNLNGHLNIGGSGTPTAAPDEAAGSGAAVSIQGNDSAGTVSVTPGAGASAGGGQLVRITFRTAYPSVPTIIISAIGPNGAKLQPYVVKSANWFSIGAAVGAKNGTSYSFDYWVVR